MLVFTIWNHIIVKNVAKGTTVDVDARYYELKARQDSIVAISAIVISTFGFFGYQTIQDAKNKMQEEYLDAKQKLFSINSSAKDLDSIIKLREDRVKILESRMRDLQRKNIIQQNIFIVEKLKMGNFKPDVNQYRTIYFKDLKTISGENLPKFATPPSILFSSRTQAWPFIKDVTTESFKINVENSIGGPDGNDNMDNIIVDVWISYKSDTNLN
jgi:hypothetical protein